MSVGKPKVRVFVFDKFGGRCAYCGLALNRARFCIDHIKPIYRGYSSKEKEQLEQKGRLGNNDVSNLILVALSVIPQKTHFTVEQWREEIRLKVDRINRDSSRYRILKMFSLVKETNKPVVFYFETHV